MSSSEMERLLKAPSEKIFSERMECGKFCIAIQVQRGKDDKIGPFLHLGHTVNNVSVRQYSGNRQQGTSTEHWSPDKIAWGLMSTIAETQFDRLGGGWFAFEASAEGFKDV